MIIFLNRPQIAVRACQPDTPPAGVPTSIVSARRPLWRAVPAAASLPADTVAAIPASLGQWPSPLTARLFPAPLLPATVLFPATVRWRTHHRRASARTTGA